MFFHQVYTSIPELHLLERQILLHTALVTLAFNSLFPVFFVAMLLCQETAQRNNFILLIQIKLFTWSLCSS